MAHVSKNGEIVLAPNHLPAPQPLPGTPGLMQYLQNGQLNQYMATSVTQNSAGVQAMLKGKLKAMGITEIVTGIISIIIGTVQVSREPYNSNDDMAFSITAGAPWWTGVPFIIAGSLAVAIERSPTDCMIKGCLSMNVISAISCLPAVIMYSINLSFAPYCYYPDDCYPCWPIVVVYNSPPAQPNPLLESNDNPTPDYMTVMEDAYHRIIEL